MNIASLLYLPPPANGKTTYGDPLAFIENLRRFRHDRPIVFYSERPEYGDMVKDLGEFVRVHDPALVRNHPGAAQNRFAIANFIFFAGLTIANVKKLSHILYLEADCRVGCDNWDDKIFEEHFNIENERELPLLLSGTVVTHNPCNFGLDMMKKWSNWFSAHQATKPLVPMAVYGNKGAAEKIAPVIYTNGALTVLNVESVSTFWDLRSNISELSVKSSPFDIELGIRAFEQCGISIFDRVACLRSMYSGYGEVLTTQSQRLRWLEDGKICAVHQTK